MIAFAIAYAVIGVAIAVLWAVLWWLLGHPFDREFLRLWAWRSATWPLWWRRWPWS